MKNQILNIETKIIVMVPYCEIYNEYILYCLESIYTQEYSNYEVIIINDGAMNFTHILDYIQNKPNFIFLNFEENYGPAHSKWQFLKFIKNNITNYNYNDIICIIDGDDYLVNNNAFLIISNTYNNYKCWFTYGNSLGNFCELNNYDIPKGWEKTNIRKKKWIYNHPRTFKLFFVNYFKENDFKFNGKWLTKGTDRPIVYNCIELAGIARTKFIDNIIYNYVEHDLNSYKTIDTKKRLEQINYLSNITPQKIIQEKIHIVMCYFNRPENLEMQIKNLNEQTVAYKIYLHILNNNSKYINLLSDLVEKLSKIYTKIKIILSHYDNLYFGFQRFIYIKDVLIKKYICDYVCIIDDDQIFNIDWVEKMYKLAKPKTYYSWYVKKWDKLNIDYWSGNTLKIPKMNKDKKYLEFNFDYGGTCGSIIDANIFHPNSLLWITELINTSDFTIYNIEDLWLSFIIKHFYGWEIKYSMLPEKETLNYPNSSSKNNSLYLTLHREKQLFLEYITYNFNYIE